MTFNFGSSVKHQIMTHLRKRAERTVQKWSIIVFFLSYAQNRTSSPSVRNLNTVNMMGLSYFFFVQTFFCSSNKFTVKLSNFSSIQIMYRFTSKYVYSKYECISSSDKWVASCDTHLCAASVHMELFFFYSMFILRRHINHSLK